jgi:hypothetical protein
MKLIVEIIEHQPSGNIEFGLHAPNQTVTPREKLYADVFLDAVREIIPMIGKALGAKAMVAEMQMPKQGEDGRS